MPRRTSRLIELDSDFWMAVEKRNGEEHSASERLRLLAVIVGILMVLAVVSVLLVPRGSQLHRCESVPVAGDREQCLYNLALATQNGSVCGMLSQQGNVATCYMAIGESTNDTGLCYKIGDSNLTAACVSEIASATNSYKACSGLNGGYRDGCIMQIASSNQNMSLCGSLLSLNNRTVCYSSIWFGKALGTGRHAYCGNVTSSPDAGIVSAIMERVNLLNYSRAYDSVDYYLMLMSFGNSAAYSARDLCYLSVATQYSNNESCAGISNSTLESGCDVAVAQQAAANATVHEQANYTSILSACLSSGQNYSDCNDTVNIIRAVSTQNATLCGTLGRNASYNCYTALASNYKNIGYCSYIGNATANQACQAYMIINQSDILNSTPQQIP